MFNLARMLLPYSEQIVDVYVRGLNMLCYPFIDSVRSECL